MAKKKSPQELNGNSMKTEDIQFNPADYVYLNDGVPLAGWMWEFIRRSPSYKTKFSNIVKLSKTTPFFYMAKPAIKDKNNLFSELRALEQDCFIRPLSFRKLNKDSKNFLLLKAVDIQKTYVGIPKPTAKYCDFQNYKPYIVGANAVVSFRFPENLLDDDHGGWDPILSVIFREELTVIDLENTLYLGVSLGASIEDIEKEIKIILRQNITRQTKKIRTDKWKYYLVTYDLRETYKKTFREITNILSEAYPKDEKLIDEKNANRWYKDAHFLINCQYKKYLNIAK